MSTPKGYGIPSFVQLAASLHTQELLAPQAAQLPAVEEMNRLYQKIESLLSVHSSNVVLSTAQKDNIRALISARMFDKGFYQFSTLSQVVIIFHSIDDDALPLARLAYQSAKKYLTGGYAKLEKGHILKLALLTSLKWAFKKLTDRDKMSPGMQVQHGAPPGKIISFANEVVDDIPIPSSMTFVALWEWFLARKKIMIGDFGSAGWQQYMDWVVEEDKRLFPLPDGEVVPGMMSASAVASYDSVDLGA
ncbi:hypothetical protein MD484_g8685, partial [Candolleomyces efflorescens]